MTLVEGVGDEILMFSGVVLSLGLVTLAWISTRVRGRDHVPEPTNQIPDAYDQEGMDALIDTLITGDAPITSNEHTDISQSASSSDSNSQSTSRSDLNIQSTELTNESTSNSSETTKKVLNECTEQTNQSQVSSETSDQSQPSSQPSGEAITVKVKFFNEMQRQVSAFKSDTIGHFKRTHFQTELAANKLVKLIYEGRLLGDDTETLERCRVRDGSVLHCLVRDAPTPTDPQQPPEVAVDPAGVGFDPSSLLIPFVVLLLALAWYARINYRNFFTTPATVTLVGTTAAFMFGVYCMYRLNRVEPRIMPN